MLQRRSLMISCKGNPALRSAGNSKQHPLSPLSGATCNPSQELHNEINSRGMVISDNSFNSSVNVLSDQHMLFAD